MNRPQIEFAYPNRRCSAARQYRPGDVAVGSLAATRPNQRRVCFTPESGHRTAGDTSDRRQKLDRVRFRFLGGTFEEKVEQNQNLILALVPRGGVTKFNGSRNLLCPTARRGPTESHRVFLNLSHRFWTVSLLRGDIAEHSRHVRFVPQAAVSSRSRIVIPIAVSCFVPLIEIRRVAVIV
jgi:hypothetical protein